ncbi:MAG: hypothetical protein ACOX9C_06330 [Kiritimatiellia bacterium]|jgi:hypothetical protein
MHCTQEIRRPQTCDRLALLPPSRHGMEPGQRLDSSTTVIDNGNLPGAHELQFGGLISGSGGLIKTNADPAYLGIYPDAAELNKFWAFDRSWTIMEATDGMIAGQFASVGNGTGWAGGRGTFSLSGGNSGDVVLSWQAPPPTVTVIIIE